MRKLWICWMLALFAASATAQTAVDMASEDHYRLLLQNDQVRVFAVSLRPTQQAFVRHDHNFLVISLQDGEVVAWREGQSPIESFHFSQGDVRFSMAGQATGLRNDRTTEYHNVTVEFLDPKVTSYGYQPEQNMWAYGSGGINPPTDPHAKFSNGLKLGAATVRDVQLLARDVLPYPPPQTAELLVPVTDVDLIFQSDRHLRKSSGEATWLGTGRSTDLLNASGGAIRFVVVEFAPQPN